VNPGIRTSEIKDFDFLPLGKAIKNARNKKSLTRGEMAELLSISEGHLANIENRGKAPGFHLFYKIVTSLDISVDEFFYPQKEPGSSLKIQVMKLMDECENKDLYAIRGTLEGMKEGARKSLRPVKQNVKPR